MSKVSENFNRSEFSCKCGCGFDTVDVELAELAEVVRMLNGDNPISPASGCRCKEHNEKIGGSPKSQHLTGRAADFPVDNPEAVYEALCELFQDKYGLGLYDTFVHVDSRSTKARWDNRG